MTAKYALQLFQLYYTMKAKSPEELVGAVIDEETGNSLEFWHLIKLDTYHTIWVKGFGKELNRLVQGIRDIPGTYAIDFIPSSNVPRGESVTYGRIVCTYHPQKKKRRTAHASLLATT